MEQWPVSSPDALLPSMEMKISGDGRFSLQGHLQHPPGQQAGVTALHSEVTLSKWHGKLDSPLCCLCSFPFSFQVAFCCRSYSRLARKCLLRQHLIFMFSSCGRFQSWLCHAATLEQTIGLSVMQTHAHGAEAASDAPPRCVCSPLR